MMAEMFLENLKIPWMSPNSTLVVQRLCPTMIEFGEALLSCQRNVYNTVS